MDFLDAASKFAASVYGGDGATPTRPNNALVSAMASRGVNAVHSDLPAAALRSRELSLNNYGNVVYGLPSTPNTTNGLPPWLSELLAATPATTSPETRSLIDRIKDYFTPTTDVLTGNVAGEPAVSPPGNDTGFNELPDGSAYQDMLGPFGGKGVRTDAPAPPPVQGWRVQTNYQDMRGPFGGKMARKEYEEWLASGGNNPTTSPPPPPPPVVPSGGKGGGAVTPTTPTVGQVGSFSGAPNTASTGLTSLSIAGAF